MTTWPQALPFKSDTVMCHHRIYKIAGFLNRRGLNVAKGLRYPSSSDVSLQIRQLGIHLICLCLRKTHRFSFCAFQESTEVVASQNFARNLNEQVSNGPLGPCAGRKMNTLHLEGKFFLCDSAATEWLSTEAFTHRHLTTSVTCFVQARHILIQQHKSLFSAFSSPKTSATINVNFKTLLSSDGYEHCTSQAPKLNFFVSGREWWSEASTINIETLKNMKWAAKWNAT